MLRKYEFSLPGISCAGCTSSIETLLANCDSLKICSYTVRVLEKDACITVNEPDKSEAEIENELKNMLDPWQPEVKAEQRPSFFSKLINNRWLKAGIGLVLGVGLLALMLSGLAIPFFAMLAIAGLSSVLTLYLGWESYYQAFNKLFRTKTLTMDVLFTVSTLAALGISIAHFFIPVLPMMFDAALLIFGFRHLGKGIEESIKEKMLSGLSFQDRVPKQVKIKQGEQWVNQPLSELRPGDIVLVEAGAIIPVDGECLSEEATIYNTIMTGNTLPHLMKKGEKVLAGMKTAEGNVELLVKKTPAESYLARLDKNIQAADASKAPIEETASKALQYFIPAIILIALAVGIAFSFFFPPLLAIQCGLSILVSACPCTLGLIVPMAIKTGMAKAGENGATFKSRESLQAADQIDTVVFDLNGTLTAGEPIVANLFFQKQKDRHLLSAIAKLEANSKHPIAKAIVNYLEPHLDPETDLSDIDKSSYCGIEANYQDKKLCIGNSQMMIKQGIDIKHLESINKQHDAEHIIYLAYNNKAIGYILLNDSLRKDALATIRELEKMGKKVHICTGADQVTALKYARKLGIAKDCVKAACVGSADNAADNAKTSYIKQLQLNGKRVAMVGDGGNDAVAFATSQLGIAVLSSSTDDMTVEKANVVVRDTSLISIVSAFEVANQTMSNIRQNLILSLSYNMLTVCLIGAAFIVIGFALNPAVGAALMVLQAGIIFMNTYRFMKKKLEHVDGAVRGSEKGGVERGSTGGLRKVLGLGMDPAHPSTSSGPRDDRLEAQRDGRCEAQCDDRREALRDAGGPALYSEDNSEIISEPVQQLAVGFGKYNH